MYFFEVNFSVAVAVGFIALFGVAVETGVLMLVYLNNSLFIKTSKTPKPQNPKTPKPHHVEFLKYYRIYYNCAYQLY